MSNKTTEMMIKENTEQRLDAYVTDNIGQYTRSFIKNLIVNGLVTINGKVVKAGAKLRMGDIVVVTVPEAEEVEICPQDIPLDIVYQDSDIAVINKPQGMVTHPAPGNPDGTLVNALMYHIVDLSGINGELRPGIVHRLDKDTSGLIVIAKNDAAHTVLSEQIGDRKMDKAYLALCHGNIKSDVGTIHTFMDRDPRDRKKMAVTRQGREAITHYTVLKRYGEYTLVEARIETGRTHQIRVHLKHIGNPVVGDSVYTRNKNKFGVAGQMLHSERLGFCHPRTGVYMEFAVPLPQYFQSVLDSLTEI